MPVHCTALEGIDLCIPQSGQASGHSASCRAKLTDASAPHRSTDLTSAAQRHAALACLAFLAPRLAEAEAAGSAFANGGAAAAGLQGSQAGGGPEAGVVPADEYGEDLTFGADAGFLRIMRDAMVRVAWRVRLQLELPAILGKP